MENEYLTNEELIAQYEKDGICGCAMECLELDVCRHKIKSEFPDLLEDENFKAGYQEAANREPAHLHKDG
jgi:hypothetical protein